MDKPTITTTRKPLPFGELSPLEFERLSLWLVEREGFVRPQHLGEAGSEQGRDVVAYKQTDGGEELWYFQCKRYQRIDAATLKKEVDKYNALAAEYPERRPHGIVFVTNASVSAGVRDDVERYCRAHGYAYDFWARNELDMRVKKYPDLVSEFFDAARGHVVAALHQLPSPPRDFTGREHEMAELTANVGRGGLHISGLHGMGGVGKTALALKLAQELAPQYSDAQFFLDLKGVSAQPLTPSDAMLHVIRSYDPTARPPENDAETRARYLSLLHGQRALLLMDNAKDAAQVEPLIPPDTCLLLVTSRKHFTLPGLFDKDLDTLPPDDARSLLLKIAPRIAERADELAHLCGRLPLALRLAASALAERKDLSAADYARRLTDARRRLELVEASLALSYDLLTPDLQKLWRALAIFPDTFDTPAAATVWELEHDATQDALGELVKYSMLDWDEETTRYGLHDLARLLAATRLSETERGVIQRRYSVHYLSLLRKAENLYLQGGDAINRSLALFDLELRNIQAGQDFAAKRFDEDNEAAISCSDYPNVGAYLLLLRQPPRERIRWLKAGLAAARQLKGRAAEGRHLGNLGLAYSHLGELARAVEFFERSLVIHREISDRRGEGIALSNLGLAYGKLDELARAIELLEQALSVFRQIGDRRSEGAVLGNLGISYSQLGETNRAIEMYEQRLTIAREVGDRHGEGIALGNLGIAYADLGENGRAMEFLEQHLAIAREIGDRRGEGDSLMNISRVLNEFDDRVRAITHVEAALDIFEQIESPRAAIAREKLAEWRGEA